MSESLDPTGPLSPGPASAAVGLADRVPARSSDGPNQATARDLATVLGVLNRLAEELQDTTWHLDDYLSELDDHAPLPPAEAPGSPGSAAGSVGAVLSQVRGLAADLRAAISAVEQAALDVSPGHRPPTLS